VDAKERKKVVCGFEWNDASFMFYCGTQMPNYAQRHCRRVRTELELLYIKFDLLLATIIQSPSLSNMFSLIPSSLSSSFSKFVALVVRLFFVFLFDASTSASSTSLRISCVLKTNFPLTATRFPFLCSLRDRNSSLYFAFSYSYRISCDAARS
jgi:hypothetical protein